MTDVPMTAFEQRLAVHLRSASSVAVRSVDPLVVTRDARAARGGVLPATGRPLFPHGLIRVAAIAVLILLLAATVVFFMVGGPNRPQFVLPGPTNGSTPLESLPLASVEPFTVPVQSPSPRASLPSTPTNSPTTTSVPTSLIIQNPAFHLGQLAYTNRDGDLFLADPDGSNASLVTSKAYDPVWYGDRLVYADSSRPGGFFDVREPGGHLRTLSSNMGDGPSWWRISPDGKTYATASGSSIVIEKPDGSTTALLPPDGFADWDPFDEGLSWMPDGSAVVASACRSSIPESNCYEARAEDLGLFLVPTDGSPPLRLDAPGAEATDALVSPDGQLIAYRGSCVDCSTLMVMRSDGSERWAVADAAAGVLPQLTYAWSADSRELAFAYEDSRIGGGGQGVWVVDADGSGGPRQIATSVGESSYDHTAHTLTGRYTIWGWAPDNSAVLVSGPADLPADGVWSIPTDGSEPTSLVPGGFMASWEWVPNN